MEERVGLYDISPKMSIVEECNSDVDVAQPLDKRLSWADIAMKNEKRLGKFV